MDIKKLLEDYSSSEAVYLCTASDEFREIWDFNKRHLLDLAKEFVKQGNHKDVKVGDIFLFYKADDPIEVRKSFLKWCIKNNENF